MKELKLQLRRIRNSAVLLLPLSNYFLYKESQTSNDRHSSYCTVYNGMSFSCDNLPISDKEEKEMTKKSKQLRQKVSICGATFLFVAVAHMNLDWNINQNPPFLRSC